MSTQYLFLIYADESGYGDMTPEKWGQMLEAHNAWGHAVTTAGGKILGGEALGPSTTATTVRKGTGTPVVTDGPFAELKEALGGYYLVECADLDQALGFAKELPATNVEVRPTVPTN